MEYKSSRSEKFMKWMHEKLGASASSDAELLVRLEKYARLLIHYHDLTGDIRPEDLHNLARATKSLQAEYENPSSESSL